MREQLLATLEEFGQEFEQERFLAAARSPHVSERNTVTVVERLYDVLLNWLHELAARGLAEGQRLGVVDKAPGPPWQRLAELGVISHASSERLQDAKELRDLLAHAYPPANWRDLHGGVQVLVDELDRYLVALQRWLAAEGILPSEQ